MQEAGAATVLVDAEMIQVCACCFFQHKQLVLCNDSCQDASGMCLLSPSGARSWYCNPTHRAAWELVNMLLAAIQAELVGGIEQVTLQLENCIPSLTVLTALHSLLRL